METPSADEDHVEVSKAPEQLLNGAFGEIVRIHLHLFIGLCVVKPIKYVRQMLVFNRRLSTTQKKI